VSRFLAVPFTPEPGAKLSYILDRLVEHDTIWSDYQKGRRDLAGAMLGNPSNLIFEVWELGKDWASGAQPAGIIMLTDLVPNVDAHCHFLFFDGKLDNKVPLLFNMMEWAFANLRIHRLSAEIPAFAINLIYFAHNVLGFRYEAEGRKLKVQDKRTHVQGRYPVRERTLTEEQAMWGSRRYQVVRSHGKWHDLILLSLTEDEFLALKRPETTDGSGTDRVEPGLGEPAQH